MILKLTCDELLYLFHLLSVVEGAQSGQGEAMKFLFNKGMSVFDAQKFINASVALFRAEEDDANALDMDEIKWYIGQALDLLREREISEAEMTLEIMLEDFF